MQWKWDFRSIGRAFALAVALLTFAAPSFARADTCLPNFMSLDVIEPITIGTPSKFSHRLKSKNAAGIFLTKVTLDGAFDGQTLVMTVRYDVKGVSLPYNIFAALVATTDAAVDWQDLTRGCSGVGASVFPKQIYKFAPVKLPGKGSKRLHIVLWGRL